MGTSMARDMGHGNGNGAWALAQAWGMAWAQGMGDASPAPPAACRLLRGPRRGWGLCQLPGFPEEPTLMGTGHQ